MTGTQLTPEKITSPIQLMAAWFAMLVLLISVLLTAAANITHPEWAAGYLVVFSSVVVLVVIACVILMLTKFRPNLQEGKEYAEWLKDQNTYSPGYVVRGVSVPDKLRRPMSAAQATQKQIIPKQSLLISVVNAVGSIELVETLKNNGFNAEVYQQKFPATEKMLNSIKNNEGIWVGTRIAPKAAIQAIKLAVLQWTDLKYLHLSNDGEEPPDFVHDQLFLGGSSSTAKSHGLHAWEKDELLGLDDEMSAEAFHSAIRAKYS